MLLPRQKPSSSYSLLKFVYVISQLVVHPPKNNPGLAPVSGTLPTYPFPKPILTLTSYLGQNVGLGEG